MKKALVSSCRFGILLALCLFFSGTLLQAFTIERDQQIAIYVAPGEPEVVTTATTLLQGDFSSVLAARLQPTSDSRKSDILVGTIKNRSMQKLLKKLKVDVSSLHNRHEAYRLEVLPDGKLLIVGSDKRGTAYGLVTLSRELGVSPWVWWADVNPQPLSSFDRPVGWRLEDAPTVPYRGIFINDEDWGMMPWASQNYEPRMRKQNGQDPTSRKGEIGPYTHARIFELLLRLKANTFWPAMHECSLPFYAVEGNLEVAKQYGISISTSHCEPMMRNANGEWRTWANDPKGNRYNYVSNPDSVRLFWEQRVRQVNDADCVFTLGMRGIHDGPMQGAKSIPDQVKALTDIIADQRSLLSRYVNSDLTKVPQQFVPYKEVLDCYNNGLSVPDDVTLIWCDDNYGYIRHQPTEAEQARSGGNGIYYHASYWGRPHDYLWLSTLHPELMRSEMVRGFDHGINRIWILNVGDIKPAEFTLSLFLDMAWHPDQFRTPESVPAYMQQWYECQTGISTVHWADLWQRYYDYSFDLKPEFSAATRTEEKDPVWKQVRDLPMNEKQLRERLQQSLAIESMLGEIPVTPATFQLVHYPVMGAMKLHQKHLYAQLARHGCGTWQPAHDAYQTIVSYTQQYNDLCDGKWRGMMDMKPRNLPVFAPVAETTTDAPMPQGRTGRVLWSSSDKVGQPLLAGESMTLKFHQGADAVTLDVRLLPVHPTDGHQIRIALSVDGGPQKVIDYHTEGRSEKWKLNVLSNSSSTQLRFPLTNGMSEHTLTVTALDDAVRLQEISLQ